MLKETAINLEPHAKASRADHRNLSQIDPTIPITVSMGLDYVLGSNYSDVPTSHAFVTGLQDLVFYGKNMFTKCNVSSKHTIEVKEESTDTSFCKDSRIVTSKFYPGGMNSACIVLKRVSDAHYISILWTELTASSLIKVNCDPLVECVNVGFFPAKGYVYLLLTDRSAAKSHQFIKVIEIQTPNSRLKQGKTNSTLSNKFKTLLNYVLKKTGGVVDDLTDLVISSDPREVYLYGKDYFRQWMLSFNDKTAKESNYRNIERNIKEEKIIKAFWVKENDFIKSNHIQPASMSECRSYLVLTTLAKILLIRCNELLKVIPIPVQSLFLHTNEQPAELALEKSLNQIYKTKFRVFPDTNDKNDRVNTEQKINCTKQIDQESREVCSVSESWVGLDQDGNKEVRFLGALSNGKVYLYKLTQEMEAKIEGQINTSQESDSVQNSFAACVKFISVSRNGKLAVFNDGKNNVYLLNQTEEDQNPHISSLYGAGHPHASKIMSISTPELSQTMVTVSMQGSLKVWDYGNDARKILIDSKPKVKPASAIIHPCGFLVIVNFAFEIKLFGLISSEMTELAAIKTSDYCVELLYSKMANLLISNQKSMIKLYEPFTLRCVGKVEPDDMRVSVLKVKISESGDCIVYQCCDFRVYFKSLNSVLEGNKNQNGWSKDDKAQSLSTFCHRQDSLYTCFQFDFGFIRSIPTTPLHSGPPTEGKQPTFETKADNFFIGFTANKYLTIYANYGRDLLVEFPIVDCWVTEAIIRNNLLLVATNTGCIRTYAWPITQEQCLVQCFQDNPLRGFLSMPKFLEEYQVWMDHSAISVMQPVANSQKILVGSEDGYIGVLSMRMFRRGNEICEKEDTQEFNERKKMVKAMNNIKLMKVSEIDRINKLIEKTEHDIDKIDFEIRNERVKKQQIMQQEQEEHERNLAKRRKGYTEEYERAHAKMQEELSALQAQLEEKKTSVQKTIAHKKQVYQQRIAYQQNKIQSIRGEMGALKQGQRQKILELIQEHKDNIRKAKTDNLREIKDLQAQFEEYASSFKESCKIEEMEGAGVNEEIEDNEIWVKVLRVEELRNDIMEKQKILEKVLAKSQAMKAEDEQLQQEFEDNLETYNNRREGNLVLHSELLKMQNQLLERQEILSKKDELISMAYREKEANLTFKDFVKGNLVGLEQHKEEAINDYMKKEEELNSVFQELRDEIQKSENKKLVVSELEEKTRLFQKEAREIEDSINDSISKIEEFKKFLLLQGVSEDTEHKQMHQEQEKMLVAINWLEKRFAMSCVNEKKMVSLKRSGMRQVIKQNKNLLEECNQLREEGIEYDKEINHLRDRLGEANKIIEIERKLKSQNHVLVSQGQKLDLIRKMFKEQIDSANRGIEEEEEVEYPF